MQARDIMQRDVFTVRDDQPVGALIDLMTSPAVSTDEETEIAGLGRMMQRLRIHRVPIVKHGKVTGIVSSLDLVGRLIENVGRS